MRQVVVAQPSPSGAGKIGRTQAAGVSGSTCVSISARAAARAASSEAASSSGARSPGVGASPVGRRASSTSCWRGSSRAATSCSVGTPRRRATPTTRSRARPAAVLLPDS
ncbi:hypothetical protein B277_07755 [Janibacter hoylei PVAS-1]|uniref:Uncharacterized protein n=1 Tax=Janibacter hoylei PVAS-1 TaxID=1210046 RepID=K1E7H2_9MICO|nr:hypothetical protein B277_07755 [Janibacter hoylei PVAS-1]